MLGVYRQIIGLSALTKAVSFVVSYGTIIVLNRFLGKELYGELIFFLSIFGYLAIVGSLGFDKLLIYRLSKYSEKPGPFFGMDYFLGLARRALVWTLLAELILIVAWCLIDPEGYRIDTLLIAVLSINTLLNTPIVMGNAYLEANKRPASAIIAAHTVMALRFAFLLALYRFGGANPELLAPYFLLPSALHLAWFWVYIGRGDHREGLVSGASSDYPYAFNMMLNKFSQIGLENIGVLFIGALLVASDVADYSVTAKIAMLVLLGNEMLAPMLGPRMKFQLENASAADVGAEYNFSRRFSTAIGVSFLLIIFVLGGRILQYFGDYAGNYNMLCLLGLAFFNKIAFGPNGRYLALRGYSGTVLSINIIALLATLVIMPICLTSMGVMGAAWATWAVLLAVNVCYQYAMQRLDGFAPLSMESFGIIVVVNGASMIGLYQLALA